MTRLRVWLSFAMLALCFSCSKSAPPQFADFSEQDLPNNLPKGIARHDVVRLFGEPVSEMETDENSCMLRFKRPENKIPHHQKGDFIGFEAYFVKDKLTRWRAWSSGDPALPESR